MTKTAIFKVTVLVTCAVWSVMDVAANDRRKPLSIGKIESVSEEFGFVVFSHNGKVKNGAEFMVRGLPKKDARLFVTRVFTKFCVAEVVTPEMGTVKIGATVTKKTDDEVNKDQTGIIFMNDVNDKLFQRRALLKESDKSTTSDLKDLSVKQIVTNEQTRRKQALLKAAEMSKSAETIPLQDRKTFKEKIRLYTKARDMYQIAKFNHPQSSVINTTIRKVEREYATNLRDKVKKLIASGSDADLKMAEETLAEMVEVDPALKPLAQVLFKTIRTKEAINEAEELKKLLP